MFSIEHSRQFEPEDPESTEATVENIAPDELEQLRGEAVEVAQDLLQDEVKSLEKKINVSDTLKSIFAGVTIGGAFYTWAKMFGLDIEQFIIGNVSDRSSFLGLQMLIGVAGFTATHFVETHIKKKLNSLKNKFGSVLKNEKDND
ncbi:hypothetical protein KKC60_04885 [Patescibacteria group bacterium]|nr:hypothetical protein [Patescibacteria group bacterium]